jgi:serine/threonine-protein kinase RsbW
LPGPAACLAPVLATLIMANEHQVTVPGRYEKIVEVCDFVAAGAEEAGFDPDDIFRIQLACDEACTNVIEHAYGGEDQGTIQVSWHNDGQAFVITIRDQGRPFDPDEVPSPSIPSDPDAIDDLRIGGLGIFFMRKLMDEVYFSSNSRQNNLVMIKYLTARAGR